MMDGVKASGERAADIVSVMLAFSWRSDPEMLSVDLREILEKAIEVESEKGKGTKLVLRLPFKIKQLPIEAP